MGTTLIKPAAGRLFTMTTQNEFYRQFAPKHVIDLRDESDRIRVLVIDEHLVTLNGLVAGLSFEKDLAVVGFATSLQRGILLAKDLHPDIILLDLNLPDATGPRTTVESFKHASKARIIIFSAEARPLFIDAVLDLGARGYLLKSEAVAQVAKAIRSVAKENKVVLSDGLSRPNCKVTKSETEILKMLARGMKYEDIAERRQSSRATVRKQCELLQLKLALRSREELIACAVNSGYGMLELD
jgi:two-component system nitrate/nitrite response regulator NarL